MFTAPLGNPAGEAYGPVIPGPESKKAKMSLKEELTQVKYSSLPKI